MVKPSTALPITREKMTLESGINAGGYFTGVVRGLAGLQSLGQPVRSPEEKPSRQSAQPVPETCTTHEIESDKIDSESLKRGWKTTYRMGGLTSMLSWIGRCGVDAGELWATTCEEFTGKDEAWSVDRLLDAAAMRMTP